MGKLKLMNVTSPKQGQLFASQKEKRDRKKKERVSKQKLLKDCY